MPKSKEHSKKWRRIGLAAIFTTTAIQPLALADESIRQFDIPAQSLNNALRQLGVAADRQVLFSEEVVARQTSKAVKGELTAVDALKKMLEGTGLIIEQTPSKVLLIKMPSAESGVNKTSLQPTPGGGTPTQSPASPTAGEARNSEPGTQKNESASIEEIVITGTRIVRDGFDSPTPIVSLSKDEILESGASDLSEFLRQIPSVSSGIDTEGSQLNTQNSGLSSINLRNLGDNRTLVLIDGRRTVSNSGNTNRVSLSTIPDGIVERIEIITGGASGVYGSDAIAGVVNIITNNDFDGLKLSARGGESSEGDAEEATFDITYGNLFNNGRSHLLFSATYADNKGIRAVDRKRALIEADYDYDDGINEFRTVGGDQPASGLTIADFRDRSKYIPGGNFDGGRFFYNENGLQEDFGIDEHGYDIRPFQTLKIPRERYLFASKFRHSLFADVDVFGQLHYSKVDTTSVRQPEDHDNNDSFAVLDPVTGIETATEVGPIPEGNPFIPTIARPRDLNWDRRFTELGPQIVDNDRETLRFWSGVKGVATAFDKPWNWEVSYGYGRYEQEQLRRNELNLLNLRHGLNVEEDPAQPGTYRCVDAAARADGCVPINLFGVGSITPEAADYLREDLLLNPVVEQHNLLAYTTGDLMQLPAGGLGVAFGMEYRKDEMDMVTDELSRNGGASAATIPSFDGAIEVFEGFLETNIPLLQGLTAAEELTLDASLRVADYSQKNVGLVTSYSVGASWWPVASMLIRTKFGRAQRAPDITELFSPPRGDFDNVTDICEGVAADTEGTVAENCRKDPGIAAAIAASPEGTFIPEGDNTASPNAGNLDLEEETANTFTFGFSLTPAFLPDFSLSIDYYKIEVEDAIAAHSNESILQQCYEDAVTFESNFFCQQITRNSGGELSQIVQRDFNLNELISEGVDLAVDYRFSLAEALRIPGDFNVRTHFTRVLKLEQHFTGSDGAEEVEKFLGELDSPLGSGSPEYQGRFSLGWRHNDLRLRWTTKYWGSMVDSHERVDAYHETLAENPAAEKPLFLFLHSYTVHDFSASYTAQAFDKAQVRYYVGIDNVFDELGPFLADGDVASGGASNYNSFYSTRGRFGYAGFEVTF